MRSGGIKIPDPFRPEREKDEYGKAVRLSGGLSFKRLAMHRFKEGVNLTKVDALDAAQFHKRSERLNLLDGKARIHSLGFACRRFLCLVLRDKRVLLGLDLGLFVLLNLVEVIDDDVPT